MNVIAKVCCALLLFAGRISAWAPASYQKNLGQIRSPVAPTLPSSVSSSGLRANIQDANDQSLASFDPLNLSSDADLSDYGLLNRALVVGSAALVFSPAAASAATKAAPDAIPSALAAYGHYLSILIIVASIMTERLTVKPAMSIDEEKRIAFADIITGVSGVGLLVSGYYRATAYGKGWDFYSHEPIFWLKMTFLGIFGGLSLFPTITIIQRSVKIQMEGTIDPMSEKLAKRMTSILNAELSALVFIPLTATFMSRGVGYLDDFPTEVVGPVFFGVVTAGAVFKYVKDAISWTEDDDLVLKEE
mmetsp:Transcript_35636/g.106346  ORF Transcript_35636/g.106346 Transcript_35636/m.106346 type:complete len:304 (+) Transcript_35636:114-1025(+)|eukprot:CAMPEP_0113546570 /NCGR_PEP_ID=MMETSP0015_2-20120614/11875_1 /TAXON_ID=2838 /ORGANISM="Odontella" /LENGTH=303 /DNA_ID=CAMNT_0000447031 /DNA_START=111 /DNA_END=1022 /DNA_ORIENTATION=- /assembly_acc=CAM_ASM_000160